MGTSAGLTELNDFENEAEEQEQKSIYTRRHRKGQDVVQRLPRKGYAQNDPELTEIMHGRPTLPNSENEKRGGSVLLREDDPVKK